MVAVMEVIQYQLSAGFLFYVIAELLNYPTNESDQRTH